MSRLETDGPGVYSIRVQGTLDPNWSDMLAGMQILVSRDEADVYSRLVGELPDQAALLGVVNSLVDFGFAIIDVRRLPED